MNLPNPYTALAGALIVAGVVLGTYLWGRGDGREAQAEDDAAEIAAVRGDLKEAATQLGASHASLKAAAVSLRAQNAANAAAIAEEQRRLAEAEAARKVAEGALAAVKAESAQYQARLDDAAKRRPDCKRLLETNVRQACGL